MFKEVKNFKPSASRKQSAERYLVAHGLRKDRVLPKELRGVSVEKEEEDYEPIPGDQLFWDEKES